MADGLRRCPECDDAARARLGAMEILFCRECGSTGWLPVSDPAVVAELLSARARLASQAATIDRLRERAEAAEGERDRLAKRAYETEQLLDYARIGLQRDDRISSADLVVDIEAHLAECRAARDEQRAATPDEEPTR